MYTHEPTQGPECMSNLRGDRRSPNYLTGISVFLIKCDTVFREPSKLLPLQQSYRAYAAGCDIQIGRHPVGQAIIRPLLG